MLLHPIAVPDLVGEPSCEDEGDTIHVCQANPFRQALEHNTPSLPLPTSIPRQQLTVVNVLRNTNTQTDSTSQHDTQSISAGTGDASLQRVKTPVKPKRKKSYSEIAAQKPTHAQGQRVTSHCNTTTKDRTSSALSTRENDRNTNNPTTFSVPNRPSQHHPHHRAPADNRRTASQLVEQPTAFEASPPPPPPSSFHPRAAPLPCFPVHMPACTAACHPTSSAPPLPSAPQRSVGAPPGRGVKSSLMLSHQLDPVPTWLSQGMAAEVSERAGVHRQKQKAAAAAGGKEDQQGPQSITPSAEMKQKPPAAGWRDGSLISSMSSVGSWREGGAQIFRRGGAACFQGQFGRGGGGQPGGFVSNMNNRFLPPPISSSPFGGFRLNEQSGEGYDGRERRGNDGCLPFLPPLSVSVPPTVSSSTGGHFAEEQIEGMQNLTTASRGSQRGRERRLPTVGLTGRGRSPVYCSKGNFNLKEEGNFERQQRINPARGETALPCPALRIPLPLNEKKDEEVSARGLGGFPSLLGVSFARGGGGVGGETGRPPLETQMETPAACDSARRQAFLRDCGQGPFPVSALRAQKKEDEEEKREPFVPAYTSFDAESQKLKHCQPSQRKEKSGAFGSSVSSPSSSSSSVAPPPVIPSRFSRLSSHTPVRAQQQENLQQKEKEESLLRLLRPSASSSSSGDPREEAGQMNAKKKRIGGQQQSTNTKGSEDTPQNKEKGKKNEREKEAPPSLYFNRKPRKVEWLPRSLDDFKAVVGEKGNGKYWELGGLGPDIFSEETLKKRARAAKVKDFSQQLRMINSQSAKHSHERERDLKGRDVKKEKDGNNQKTQEGRGKGQGETATGRDGEGAPRWGAEGEILEKKERAHKARRRALEFAKSIRRPSVTSAASLSGSRSVSEAAPSASVSVSASGRAGRPLKALPPSLCLNSPSRSVTASVSVAGRPSHSVSHPQPMNRKDDWWGEQSELALSQMGRRKDGEKEGTQEPTSSCLSRGPRHAPLHSVGTSMHGPRHQTGGVCEVGIGKVVKGHSTGEEGARHRVRRGGGGSSFGGMGGRGETNGHTKPQSVKDRREGSEVCGSACPVGDKSSGFAETSRLLLKWRETGGDAEAVNAALIESGLSRHLSQRKQVEEVRSFLKTLGSPAR